VAKALADAERTPARDSWQLRGGDVVVLTGTTERAATAEAAGLTVGDSVNKRTRLLVATDPAATSVEAVRARQYGVPIVHPQAYRAMLETLLQPV
jgi:DNA polymerase-3 subunit epsilon